MKYEYDRRPLTPEEEEKVRFWTDALLHGRNPEKAAHELYAIGVRTRGAVRTRGSVSHAAPSRFPSDIDNKPILEMFQTDTSPSIRITVASALAEMGGQEAIPILRRLVIGTERDEDVGVRAAALDAIGFIGGPVALEVLETVVMNDPDPSIQGIAIGLIVSLGKNEPDNAVKILNHLTQILPEGEIHDQVISAKKIFSSR